MVKSEVSKNTVDTSISTEAHSKIKESLSSIDNYKQYEYNNRHIDYEVDFDRKKIMDKSADETLKSTRNFMVVIERDVKKSPLLFNDFETTDSGFEHNNLLTIKDSIFYFHRNPPRIKLMIIIIILLVCLFIWILYKWNSDSII